MGRTFGAYDFTQHDLDEPFPDLSDRVKRSGRRGLELIQQAQENGWSIRQTVEAVSEYKQGPFVGSPETVADEIQRWFEGRASDGFNLAFRLQEELTYFVDTVVPILRSAGSTAPDTRPRLCVETSVSPSRRTGTPRHATTQAFGPRRWLRYDGVQGAANPGPHPDHHPASRPPTGPGHEPHLVPSVASWSPTSRGRTRPTSRTSRRPGDRSGGSPFRPPS
jgi:hypothetical protein